MTWKSTWNPQVTAFVIAAIAKSARFMEKSYDQAIMRHMMPRKPSANIFQTKIYHLLILNVRNFTKMMIFPLCEYSRNLDLSSDPIELLQKKKALKSWNTSTETSAKNWGPILETTWIEIGPIYRYWRNTLRTRNRRHFRRFKRNFWKVKKKLASLQVHLLSSRSLCSLDWTAIQREHTSSKLLPIFLVTILFIFNAHQPSPSYSVHERYLRHVFTHLPIVCQCLRYSSRLSSTDSTLMPPRLVFPPK